MNAILERVLARHHSGQDLPAHERRQWEAAVDGNLREKLERLLDGLEVPGEAEVAAAPCSAVLQSDPLGSPGLSQGGLSVLRRCVPKTLAFAFGLRLRSRTRCFKTRVLRRRLPNGKPQERLRFRALRSKTLAFKKRIAIILCDLKTSLGARACV